MSLTYDVAVVGGGVIGCAVACELAQRGARVVLLERERMGVGASGAAAGMLAPQSEADADDDWFRLLLAARAEHAPLACLLRHETGMDVGYRRDGVLRVALDDAERAELQARAAWQQAAGLAAEWLEPEEASRREAALSPDTAGALWLPDEAQVHAPRLVQALSVLAARRGVAIHEGTPVLGIEVAGRRLHAVNTTAERLPVGGVVLAAGVWTPELKGLPQALPVGPVKGQIVRGVLTPSCAPRGMIWGHDAYMTPKADGGLLIGATEEPGCFDTRPTLGAIRGLVAAAEKLVPSVRGTPLSSAWAGLRPALPNRRPFVGRFGDVDGLFVATGHYRNGILLGPLAGKQLADELLAPSSHEGVNCQTSVLPAVLTTDD